MIKVIKKQPTGTFNATRRKGNYLIGESTVNYGPTEVTGFYGAIEPPEGGFTLYMDKETGGPSIKVFDTQQKLIDFCNEKLGSDQSTIFDTIDWINQQDDYFVDPNYFEFSVKTDNTGTSSSNQFQLPLISSGDINFLVDWGDGNTDTITTYNQSETTHTYTSGGTYTIKIAGIIKGFKFNNGGDKLKMLNISNWGCLDINTDASFSGCENMTCSAVDAPIISTTSLYVTFSFCREFDTDISNWDLTSVTNVIQMLYQASKYTNNNSGLINNMDVTSIGNFQRMFYGTGFNQNIKDWDVSNASSISNLFAYTSFNQDISSWDVSNINNMEGTFRYNLIFNQDISSWDVSSVIDMRRMFINATAFDQDLSNWDIRQVTNFNDFMSNDAGLSTINYDSTLIGWEQTLQSSFPNGSGYTPVITINFGNSKYTPNSAAATARQSLIDNYNWTITDGGPA